MSNSTSPPNTSTPGFLDDHNGQSSSMRLMSFVALLMAFAFGLIAALHPTANDANALYLSIGFLIAAFAPKALQKFAEAKFPIAKS